MNLVQLSPDFIVSRRLTREVVRSAKARGSRRIVNLLPLEDQSSLSLEADVRAYAETLGISYLHIPVPAHALLDEGSIAQARAAFDPQHGPVLASCNTGQRAAFLWAAVAVESTPVGEVLGALAASGFDVSFLREELVQLSTRAQDARQKQAA